jgi:hypothetical protein
VHDVGHTVTGLTWPREEDSPLPGNAAASSGQSRRRAPARRWPCRLRAKSPASGHCQVPQMPRDMSASPEHCRERRGSFHVRTSVAGKSAPPSLVLVYCIGAIALLASVGRTLAPKVLIHSLLAPESALLNW